MRILSLTFLILSALPASAESPYKILVEHNWCRLRYVSGAYQMVRSSFNKRGNFSTTVLNEDGSVDTRIGGRWNLEENILTTRIFGNSSESRIEFSYIDGFYHMKLQELQPRRGNGLYRLRDCEDFE